jgi:hypothetical protein
MISQEKQMPNILGIHKWIIEIIEGVPLFPSPRKHGGKLGGIDRTSTRLDQK